MPSRSRADGRSNQVTMPWRYRSGSKNLISSTNRMCAGFSRTYAT